MRDDKRKQHVVKEGEDVFMIAKDVYGGDLRKAFEIMEINPGVCKLYPGLVLELPERG